MKSDKSVPETGKEKRTEERVGVGRGVVGEEEEGGNEEGSTAGTVEGRERSESGRREGNHLL